MKPTEGGLADGWAADAPALSLDLWLDALDEPAWLVESGGGRVLQANAAAAAWLALSSRELIGRRADEMLPSLEDSAFWAERRLGLPGDRLCSSLELPSPSGQLAQFNRRIVPLGSPPQAYLVSLQDRSAERRAAQEREALLAELRATLEATADGILVLDLSGRIRAFNRRFAALWRLPEAALAGQSDAELQDWMRQSVLQPESYARRLDDIASQLLLSATDRIPLLDGSLLERHTHPQWSAGRPIGRV
jgi:PAS domain-containing protein